MIAGLVGLLAIIAMMIMVYKIPGLVSSITLLFYTAAILVVFNLIGGEYGPDTIAAIVGSISESYYGIPETIKQQTKPYLKDYMYSLLEDRYYKNEKVREKKYEKNNWFIKRKT